MWRHCITNSSIPYFWKNFDTNQILIIFHIACFLFPPLCRFFSFLSFLFIFISWRCRFFSITSFYHQCLKTSVLYTQVWVPFLSFQFDLYYFSIKKNNVFLQHRKISFRKVKKLFPLLYFLCSLILEFLLDI